MRVKFWSLHIIKTRNNLYAILQIGYTRTQENNAKLDLRVLQILFLLDIRIIRMVQTYTYNIRVTVFFPPVTNLGLY